MKLHCSACGAKNDPSNNECQYCGNSLSIQTGDFESKIKVINEQGNKFKLAEVAFEGENYDEAINYYNACLEIDPDFFEAWYKKGISILLTSTVGNFKFKNAISSFKESINNSPNKVFFKKRLASEVTVFTLNYYYVSYNHYSQFKELSSSKAEFLAKINQIDDILLFLINEVGFTMTEVRNTYNCVNEIILTLAWIRVKSNSFTSHIPTQTEKNLEAMVTRLKEIWTDLEPDTLPQKKSGCFIATATMGDYNHPIVIELRQFRDEWLLKRAWGVNFTKWYYTHGPKAAMVIEKSNILKAITFFFIIKPLQKISKLVK
jgi:tetratricopeptide (TPR) repeat protein